MNLIVHSTPELSGSATVPSSKSQSIRALFFALLARGSSTLTNWLDCEDTRDAMRVVQALGATIRYQKNQLILNSPGLPLSNAQSVIHTGNSGITTLFAMPLLGYQADPSKVITYDCGMQMRARPIYPLIRALIDLGLHIDNTACPLAISGHLQGGKIVLDGSHSQYLSSLLIALPCAAVESEMTVHNLNERPYVLMTLDWLQAQHIHFYHHATANMDIFTIPGRQQYRPFQKNLHGDFSSASYLIAAGVLIGNCIELSGLNMQDPQGDKRLIPLLQAMGADIVVEPNRLVIRGGKTLTGICIDANDIPDLLPTLAVIGTQATGKTMITGVRHARIKETDRIHVMTQGLRRMGAHIEEQADGMIIYPCKLRGNHIQGYGDHRSVMALALAGLLADGTTVIDQAEAIHKTFPTFLEKMQSLGANMAVAGHEN